MNTPWIESPFFDEILPSKNLSEEEKKIAQQYHDNGFVVVSGLFNEELINQVKQETEKAFDPTVPLKIFRDETRIQDLWTASEPVKNLSIASSVITIPE